jgi:DNA glycosylase AlkZ-like
VTAEVLGRRALNRATLERQLLLRRSPLGALDAVEHLVGLQAQVPLNPYTALWSRLEAFQPDELATLLVERRVVRTVLMRATIHLVSADDCLDLRPLVQPVLDRELARHPEHGPALAETDLNPVLDFARTALAGRPLTGRQLRDQLAAHFPEENAAALAYACRNLLAFVQVPPRGVWGRTSRVTVTTAESWLGRPLAAASSLERLVLRYLAAFGPATVGDGATWSRLTGLREVVERLRPELRTFRDERGRELFDLPDAPRPEPDTPAPPRFLPEYDNVLLSHHDRSRFITTEARDRASRVAPPIHGTVLDDGFVYALWRLERGGDTAAATLLVSVVGRRTRRADAAVAAEGRRLLRFAASDARAHDVRFVPVE